MVNQTRMPKERAESGHPNRVLSQILMTPHAGELHRSSIVASILSRVHRRASAHRMDSLAYDFSQFPSSPLSAEKVLSVRQWPLSDEIQFPDVFLTIHRPKTEFPLWLNTLRSL